MKIFLALFFLCTTVDAAPKVKVPAVRAKTVKILAAAPNTPTVTVDWSDFILHRNKSATLTVQYAGAGGTQLHLTVLALDSACTVLSDTTNNSTVYKTAGKNDPLCVALASVTEALDKAVAACVASGKCNLQ